MRWRWAAAVVSGAMACRRAPAPSSGAVLPDDAPPVRIASERSGTVVEGRFVDRDGGFEIDVPTGWRARPGRSDGSLRLSLDDPDTGAHVEVWREPAGSGRLPDRSGCLWTFEDEGPYLDLRVREARTVGTCMPDDPGRPRLHAWKVERTGWDWWVELHLPQEAMLHARRASLAVLASARWER